MDNLPSSNKSYPIMPDIHVSLDCVVKLLSELQENKAPGPDGLSPKILKLCAKEVAPALTSIFNKSMLTGELPTCLVIGWRQTFHLYTKRVIERQRPTTGQFL